MIQISSSKILFELLFLFFLHGFKKSSNMSLKLFACPFLFFFLLRLLFLLLIWAVSAKMPMFPTSETQPLFHRISSLLYSHGIHIHGFRIFLREVPSFFWFLLLFIFLFGYSPEHSLSFFISVVHLLGPFVPVNKFDRRIVKKHNFSL